MKKFVLLCSVCFLFACTENRNDLFISKDMSLSSPELLQELENVASKYRVNSSSAEKTQYLLDVKTVFPQTSPLPLSPDSFLLEVSTYDERMMKEIHLMDQMGYQIGMLQGNQEGSIYGACVGAIVGAFGGYTGAVFGAGVGSLLGGYLRGNYLANQMSAYYSAAWSCEIVVPMDDGRPEVVIRNFPDNINATVPLNDYKNTTPVLGMHCGYYHNDLLKNFFTRYSMKEIVDMDKFVLAEEMSKVSGDILGEEVPYEVTEFVYNCFVQGNSTSSTEVDNIIDCYIEGVENIHGAFLTQYTVDFMRAVEEYAMQDTSMFSEALLINGSISILMHSKYLWKTNLPDPNISDVFIFQDINADWIICDLGQLAQAIRDGIVLIYGVPSIENGRLASMFFYDIFMENYDMDSDVYDEIYNQLHMDWSGNVSVVHPYLSNEIISGPNMDYDVYSIEDKGVHFVCFTQE